jgi:hypothetical protein
LALDGRWRIVFATTNIELIFEADWPRVSAIGADRA